MKNLNQRILTQEEFGRAIYLQHHTGMQWITNNDKYGIWDISGSTAEYFPVNPLDYYVEVKARDVKSSTYPTTFLEVKKCKALLIQAQNSPNKGKAFYFVTFTDHKSYLFDLTKLWEKGFKTSEIYMPKSTFIDDEFWIKKQIIELPLTAAVKVYNN
ncbi:hypothetical protein [Pedobacter immunditicola]|uniref:hypothetical protein n=1 Tax=Pedobacter immunditicola TaxID=3133440 RepID=UPI003095E2C9